MSHRIVFPVVIAVACLANARSAQAAPPDAGADGGPCNVRVPVPPCAFRVSVVLMPPVPGSRRQIRVMMRETDAIWRPYGVTLVWLGEGAGESGVWPAALLRVQFAQGVRATSRIGSPDASRLGAIQFFDGVVPDDIILLSTDEIAATVMSSQLSERDLHELPTGLVEDATGRATGRVLAHELGHYLLASRTHARKGLMRRSFAGRQLVGWDRRAFTLDAAAVLRLRSRAAEPTAAAIGPRPNGGL